MHAYSLFPAARNRACQSNHLVCTRNNDDEQRVCTCWTIMAVSVPTKCLACGCDTVAGERRSLASEVSSVVLPTLKYFISKQIVSLTSIIILCIHYTHTVHAHGKSCDFKQEVVWLWQNVVDSCMFSLNKLYACISPDSSLALQRKRLGCQTN